MNAIDPPSSSGKRPVVAVAWMIALALFAFIAVWPLMTGMAAANDDLKFIRNAEYSGTFAEDVRMGWTTQSNFRPLENLAALLCDERTLECRPVMVIQLLGLLALAFAVARLTKRLLPDQPLALPLALTWIALSPATTISIWQMDTCSQTWTAALGAWAGVLTIAGVDAAREGRSVFKHMLILTLLFAVGVNIKEMFYGWSAGVGTALIIAMLFLWKRERGAAMKSALLLLPIAALPALHLLIRLKFSALSQAVETGAAGEVADASRYQVGLGWNVINNAGLSVLGLFADGPLHNVKDAAAPTMLRLLPLAALLASFIALAAAGGLAIVHRNPSRAASRRMLLLAAFGGFASLCITLPMGSVSELYGLGPNIASGLLLAAALLALWNPADAGERTLTRSIAVGCAGGLLLIGVVGIASRAYHFQLTWRYARDLNAKLLAFQESLPEIDVKRDGPARIHFSQPCYTGELHSQYIVAPILAVGLDQTMDWMNRINPSRPVTFLTERTFGAKREHDLDITCDDLPQRRHW